MKGKFVEYNEIVRLFCVLAAMLICGAAVGFSSPVAVRALNADSAVPGILYVVCLLALLFFLLLYITNIFCKGSFSTDEEGITFRSGMNKRKIYYHEIRSAGADVFFEPGRGGSKVPMYRLVIRLDDKSSVTYTDYKRSFGSCSLDSLNNSLKKHTFTELCNYINAHGELKK